MLSSHRCSARSPSAVPGPLHMERSLSGLRFGIVYTFNRPELLVCSGCHNKDHRLGGFNHRNVLPSSSGVWKSKISLSIRLASIAPSFLGLQMTAFSLCPHTAFPLRLHFPGVSFQVQISSDTSQIELGPPYWPCLNLIPSLKDLSPNVVKFWGAGG